jgi:hypothetical protein
MPVFVDERLAHLLVLLSHNDKGHLSDVAVATSMCESNLQGYDETDWSGDGSGTQALSVRLTHHDQGQLNIHMSCAMKFQRTLSLRESHMVDAVKHPPGVAGSGMGACAVCSACCQATGGNADKTMRNTPKEGADRTSSGSEHLTAASAVTCRPNAVRLAANLASNVSLSCVCEF